MNLERDFPLARLTTIRAGGNAELFARPASEEELVELLAWAEREGHPVEVVGSGSNLLVADAGVRGLVLKLDGALTEIEREGTRIVCGGGVRLPSAAAKVARWGLTGLEFGINLPGTVGGAVRMNANAYGGQLAKVLEWVDVCGPDGADRRGPDQLGFSYRRSNLRPGQVVSFDATVSTAPPGRSIARHEWNFGDNSPVLSGVEPRPTHTYGAAGTYVVTLTVIDSSNVRSVAVTKNVTVTP